MGNALGGNPDGLVRTAIESCVNHTKRDVPGHQDSHAMHVKMAAIVYSQGAFLMSRHSNDSLIHEGNAGRLRALYCSSIWISH